MHKTKTKVDIYSYFSNMNLSNVYFNLYAKDIYDERFEIDHLLMKLNWTFRDLMDENSLKCEDILANCKWENSATPCNELFEKTLSILGYCCSFNYYGLVK